MDQFTAQVFMEIITDATFVAITAAILIYAVRKEKLRQETLDNRYEKTLTTFVNITTDYMAQTVDVIKSLPDKQRLMIETVSNNHLKTIDKLMERFMDNGKI